MDYVYVGWKHIKNRTSSKLINCNLDGGVYVNMSDIIRIPCGNVNAFLIKEKSHAVLVDTGLAGYTEKIYDACKDSYVECIILTHGQTTLKTQQFCLNN